MNLPIEIINRILVYVAEMSDDMYILQYNTKTNKSYYKLNFLSHSLRHIDFVVSIKKFYPFFISNQNEKKKLNLYQLKYVYMKLLRDQKVIHIKNQCIQEADRYRDTKTDTDAEK